MAPTAASGVYDTVTRAHALFTLLVLVPAVCSYINAVHFRGRGDGGGMFNEPVTATFMAWFWGAAGALACAATVVSDAVVTPLPPHLRMFTYGWFVSVTAVGFVKAVLDPASDTLTLFGLVMCATVYTARAPLSARRGHLGLAVACHSAFAFLSLGPAVCGFVNAQEAAGGGDPPVSGVLMAALWGGAGGACMLAFEAGRFFGVDAPPPAAYVVWYSHTWFATATAVGVLKALIDPAANTILLSVAAVCAAMHLVRGGAADVPAGPPTAARGWRAGRAYASIEHDE